MKLLRKRKKFGRCCIKGHGCDCTVSKEIQSKPYTRVQEKKEIEEELKYETH